MERRTIAPRPEWQTRVESQGLHFHTVDGEPCWDESACYVFKSAEVDAIEKATYELDRMCLEAVEHIVSKKLWDRFGILQPFVDWIAQSWERDELTIYGRFDLSYDGQGPPQLLEYNADTPTALLEAAVVQWYWLKDTRPNGDQFNTIHERLIEAWGAAKARGDTRWLFTSLRGQLEDYMTVNYLRDTAIQAGLATEFIHIEDIGWNERLGAFVDVNEQPLPAVFKLYPWEWMFRDSFGQFLPRATTRWLEPPWKVLLSNKMILAVLWELFPESPYLLRTEREPFGDTYIRKPAQGREGANVRLVVDGQTVLETEGAYGKGPFVHQDVKPLPKFGDRYAVVGSWMVNGFACGMGIREDESPVTCNTSRFVPHIFEK